MELPPGLVEGLVEGLCGAWSLPPATAVTSGGGYANFNLSLETPAGRYFVKLRRRSGLADVRAEAVIINHLSGNGVPTPGLVARPSGEWLWDSPWGIATLQPWLEGQAPEALDACTAGRLGRLLAQLHRVDTTDVPQRNGWWRRGHAEGLLAELEGAVPARRRQQLETALRDSAWLHEAGLPRAIVHGDTWADNLLIDSDGAMHLVDWDEAALCPAVFDLAYALLFSSFPDGDYRPDIAVSLVEGYRTGRSVSAAERHAMGPCLERLRCTNYLWLLREHLAGDMPSPDWLWDLEVQRLAAEFEE